MPAYTEIKIAPQGESLRLGGFYVATPILLRTV